jgi:hypothetical protein
MGVRGEGEGDKGKGKDDGQGEGVMGDRILVMGTREGEESHGRRRRGQGEWER